MRKSETYPDYSGSSIVNLASSIIAAFGGKPTYNSLSFFSSSELASAKNIVLVVVDGLGYNYLLSRRDSFLGRNILGKMTSVLPSTTAAAITTFMTGLAPMQHAITGWHMYFKELGMVTTILPFVPRIGGPVLSHSGIDAGRLIGQKSIFSRIKADSFAIQHQSVSNSNYTNAFCKGVKRLAYKDMAGFFQAIKFSLDAKTRKRKFIYAYWPMLDSLGHEFGINSKKAKSHFRMLDKSFENFISKTLTQGTIMIITADHGQIDAPRTRHINIARHPKLLETLRLPLCGEPRFAYCYVKLGKARQFERYVKSRLGHACHLLKSKDLMERGRFGLLTPNPKLMDRIGDYVLAMKDNWVIKEFLYNEEEIFNIGNHGGISADEMLVPLIILRK